MFNIIQLPILRWIPQALTPRAAPGAALSQSPSDEIGKKGVEQGKAPSFEDIRSVIVELLSRCHVPFNRTPYVHDFHDLCIQECRLKGYPIDRSHGPGRAPVLKYLPSGVIIVSTAYAHLQNQSTRVFIAVYTAFMVWVDDTYAKDVQGINTFHERLVKGQKQENEDLDGVARVLGEINLHWHGTQANLILTSSLNFIASIIMDFEAHGMTVSPHAKSYVEFQRAMFAYPREVPMSTYLQAIPDHGLFINYLNDVLSFYKEERVGENGNYISNEACLRGEGKLPVLRELAHDVFLCVSRVSNILEGKQGAAEAFQQFMRGYVAFHTSFDSRYHLDDLFPQ